MNRILSCAAVLGLLVASSSSVLAKGPGGQGGGASHFTPAYASQNPSSSTLKPAGGLSGPSAYAPGQQMRDPTSTGGASSAPGNGAAVYAPGFLK
jgi:hypothetical protein